MKSHCGILCAWQQRFKTAQVCFLKSRGEKQHKGQEKSTDDDDVQMVLLPHSMWFSPPPSAGGNRLLTSHHITSHHRFSFLFHMKETNLLLVQQNLNCKILSAISSYKVVQYATRLQRSKKSATIYCWARSSSWLRNIAQSSLEIIFFLTSNCMHMMSIEEAGHEWASHCNQLKWQKDSWAVLSIRFKGCTALFYRCRKTCTLVPSFSEEAWQKLQWRGTAHNRWSIPPCHSSNNNYSNQMRIGIYMSIACEFVLQFKPLNLDCRLCTSRSSFVKNCRQMCKQYYGSP
jgi:hypothetical protein